MKGGGGRIVCGSTDKQPQGKVGCSWCSVAELGVEAGSGGAEQLFFLVNKSLKSELA